MSKNKPLIEEITGFLDAYVRCDCIHFFGDECNDNSDWKGECPYLKKGKEYCTKCSVGEAERILKRIKKEYKHEQQQI